jgi:hypothetical protein
MGGTRARGQLPASAPAAGKKRTGKARTLASEAPAPPTSCACAGHAGSCSGAGARPGDSHLRKRRFRTVVGRRMSA